MLKAKSKVVYPKHGAGIITQVYKIDTPDGEKNYYKLQFLSSPVSVSVPISNAKELGLRKLSTKEAQAILSKLGTRIRITKEALKNLDITAKELLDSGKLEDAVQLLNMLRSLAQQKEEENKNFSYSYSDRLEIAIDFIKSEVEQALGKRALKKYEF